MRLPRFGSHRRPPLIQNFRYPSIPCDSGRSAALLSGAPCTCFSAPFHWHQLSSQRLDICGTWTAHASGSFFMQTFPPRSAVVCLDEFPSETGGLGHPGQGRTLGVQRLFVRVRVVFLTVVPRIQCRHEGCPTDRATLRADGRRECWWNGWKTSRTSAVLSCGLRTFEAPLFPTNDSLAVHEARTLVRPFILLLGVRGQPLGAVSATVIDIVQSQRDQTDILVYHTFGMDFFLLQKVQFSLKFSILNIINSICPLNSGRAKTRSFQSRHRYSDKWFQEHWLPVKLPVYAIIRILCDALFCDTCIFHCF